MELSRHWLIWHWVSLFWRYGGFWCYCLKFDELIPFHFNSIHHHHHHFIDDECIPFCALMGCHYYDVESKRKCRLMAFHWDVVNVFCLLLMILCVLINWKWAKYRYKTECGWEYDRQIWWTMWNNSISIKNTRLITSAITSKNVRDILKKIQ